MPLYAYVARSSAGAALQGELTAPSEQDAARLLRADGKYVVKLTLRSRERPGAAPTAAPASAPFRRGRVQSGELVLFLNQLAIMVETGVSLVEALDGIHAQTLPGRFREVQRRILDEVRSGQPFSTALASQQGVFPPMFVNLVKAAEASGTLGIILRRCAEHLAYQREVRKQVKSALVYPISLAVAAVAVTIFLMSYVLPKFTAIYAGKEAALPLPTQCLIGLSEGLTAHWKLWLVVGLICASAAVWFFRASAMRPYAHALTLKFPLFGRMLAKSSITSGLRTLGILVDSGVPVTEAVAITRATATSHPFERMWSEVDARLLRGEQLSVPLYQSPLMPRPLVQMIEAGERAGRLGPVLQKLSDFLDQDLRLTIKNLTQLIEPVMIAVMGAIVGGIAIALLLPILSISKVMGQ